MEYLNDKNKRKGIIVTVVIHVLILLLFIFTGLTIPVPLPEQGIRVNFGTTEEGMGEVQPDEANTSDEEQVAEMPEEVVASNPEPIPEVEEIITQSTEDAPAVNTADPVEVEPEVESKSDNHNDIEDNTDSDSNSDADDRSGDCDINTLQSSFISNCSSTYESLHLKYTSLSTNVSNQLSSYMNQPFLLGRSNINPILSNMKPHNESCCVCLDDFSANVELRLLPCHHAFHPKCIDPV